jgi:hypothetical protein
MATKQPPKNDIFEVLGKIGKKKAQYYDSLPTDKQAAIQPYILQRWMYGANDSLQVMLLNEAVNPHVFSLQQHKALLWKLLTVAATGSRASWKPFSNGPKGQAAKVDIIAKYHNIKISEAEYLLQRYTEEDIEQMKQELGVNE